MSNVTKYLSELDLCNYEKLHNYIFTNRIKEINDLVIYLRGLIKNDYTLKKYSPFTFVPNDDITGAGGCDEVSCKINRASKFANFSALYADRVYIQLGFIASEHYELHDLEEIEENDFADDRYRILVEADLALIITYFNLIENNIVCITPPEHMKCKSCMQKEIFGMVDVVDFDKLKKDYVKKSKVILQDFDRVYGSMEISIGNIPEFFPDHDLFWTIDNIETVKLLSNEKIGAEIKNKKFVEEFMNDFFEDEIIRICYTTKYCQEQNAKLITNKVSDSMFLGMNKRYKNLTHLENQHNLLPEYVLPIVENLNLTDIIRLREEEHEAFNKYRIALNAAVAEQIKTDNQSNWKKIYDDIIFPELNNLEMKLKQAKKGRWSHFFGTMGIAGSVIIGSSFGDAISLGMLAQAVVASTAVATATGLNIILDRHNNNKANLQDSDYFFLWKLNSKIKK